MRIWWDFPNFKFNILSPFLPQIKIVRSSHPEVFWHRCFPVNFAKFLRTSIFTKDLPWLLLNCVKLKIPQKTAFYVSWFQNEPLSWNLLLIYYSKCSIWEWHFHFLLRSTEIPEILKRLWQTTRTPLWKIFYL